MNRVRTASAWLDSNVVSRVRDRYARLESAFVRRGVDRAVRRYKFEGTRPLRFGLLLSALLTLTFAVGVASLCAWALWELLGEPKFAPSRPGPLTPTDIYDGIKIALTVVGGIGGVIALVVAYRKQRLGEAAHAREDYKLYNERFGAASDQIGSEKAAVRLAGVYAMANLADDWEVGRQTCIDVLCAYLRMPYERPTKPASPINFVPNPMQPPPSLPREFVDAMLRHREEQQVRHTVIRVIGAHLRDAAAVSWRGSDFDFTGAVFDGGDFSDAVFTGGKVSFVGARFSDGLVSFRRAKFVGPGSVFFAGANFSGGVVNFNEAQFAGGQVDFYRAAFTGAEVSFAAAQFSGGMVNFYQAAFSGGMVDFARAEFSGCRLTFAKARFEGRVGFVTARFTGGSVRFGAAQFMSGEVNFGAAQFDGAEVSFNGAHFAGSFVHFRSAHFAGGTVNFVRSEFAVGSVYFDRAHFVGAVVDFSGGQFIGGTVDLSDVEKFDVKPRFSNWAAPPAGLLLPHTTPQQVTDDPPDLATPQQRTEEPDVVTEPRDPS